MALTKNFSFIVIRSHDDKSRYTLVKEKIDTSEHIVLKLKEPKTVSQRIQTVAYLVRRFL